MPSGNIATGTLNRIARTNAALGGNLPDLLGTPIRQNPGTTVYLRDIGTIENGTDLITAYAHVNGRRTVYIPVTKRADASTVSVINAVKAAIPEFKKAVPDDVDVRLEFDQWPYVRNSIRGLVVEGLLGAALTGLMVLIFLRDWRSALIVVLNIPFALLSAARRAGIGCRRSGGRGHGGDREHPHADVAGRLARPRRGGGVPAHGDGSLSPGMYPSVKWPIRRTRPPLLVPKTSVVTTAERTFVVRGRNGKAEWVDVKKGAADGDNIEVMGNLQAGEMVVRRATDEIRDGAALAGK